MRKSAQTMRKGQIEQLAFRRDRILVPTPQNRCRICMETRRDPRALGLRLGYGGSNSQALTGEANTLAFTSAWCRETRDVWASRGCPRCDPGGTGDALVVSSDLVDVCLLCRAHLREVQPLTRDTGEQVAQRLLEIRTRLLRLTRSMTDRGDPATAQDNASWVEALGWFAGWALPQYLATPPHGPER